MSEPFHKIQEANIQASIWKNEGGSSGHYFTVSLSKSYQRDNETHFTTSFGKPCNSRTAQIMKRRLALNSCRY